MQSILHGILWNHSMAERFSINNHAEMHRAIKRRSFWKKNLEVFFQRIPAWLLTFLIILIVVRKFRALDQKWSAANFQQGFVRSILHEELLCARTLHEQFLRVKSRWIFKVNFCLLLKKILLERMLFLWIDISLQIRSMARRSSMNDHAGMHLAIKRSSFWMKNFEDLFLFQRILAWLFL